MRRPFIHMSKQQLKEAQDHMALTLKQVMIDGDEEGFEVIGGVLWQFGTQKEHTTLSTLEWSYVQESIEKVYDRHSHTLAESL